MALAQGRKRCHDSDPEEGTSATKNQPKRIRGMAPSSKHHSKTSQAYKDEQRRHRAIEHAIQRAQQEAQKEARSPPISEPTPALATVSPEAVHPSATQSSPWASLSPDISLQGVAASSADAAILCATLTAKGSLQANPRQRVSHLSPPASMVDRPRSDHPANPQDTQFTPV